MDQGPSYANVQGPFPRQSPIMGRRALGPPSGSGGQPPSSQSPKLQHKRQASEVIKNEVLHAQQQSPVSNSSSNAGSSDNSSSMVVPPALVQQVNLKPVTSIHQVLYQGQEKYHRVNGHHQDQFEMMKTESPIFPSTTTSVSMQSPIQSSLSSPSQDHGYCSNTNDRQVLEKNLEKLISERGMDVIGQLTKEMSPQQIERLLVQTKQKLQGTNSVPLLQPA